MVNIAQKDYLRQLDGLRFIAVSLVMIDHWSADSLGFPASYLGVCMFFVLSGFLITRILLNSKAKDDSLQASHSFSLRQFYIRRSIRIFPIYYITIFILFLYNVPPVRAEIWWCIGYATNINIAIQEHWLGVIDHLWSLAVEEQFYVFFPFVIFFIPNKYLIKTLLAFIVIAVGLRLYFFETGQSWIRPYVLMPTCLDAFGMGALLAYIYFSDNKGIKAVFNNKSYLLLSLLLYLVVVILSHQMANVHNFISIIFLRFFESLFSLFLIAKAINGFGGIIKQLLENPIANYLGKISYGLYIYHNFIYNPYHATPQYISVRLFNHLPFIRDNMPLKIAFLYIITVAIASLSWFIIEKPINALKDKFKY